MELLVKHPLFDWKLLVAVNSSKKQNIDRYKKNATKMFELWNETFTKPMTANVHMLVAHATDYIRL